MIWTVTTKGRNKVIGYIWENLKKPLAFELFQALESSNYTEYYLLHLNNLSSDTDWLLQV